MPSADRDFLFDRRVNLMTGKGGVGRTTVAVAFARAAARQGRRVLLTEVGDADDGESPIGTFFGRPQLTDVPAPVSTGLHVCQLWASTGHELFARAVIPAGALVSAALRSKAMRRFMSAAPSFHELGILYHFLRLLDETDGRGAPRFETVVVDMPATGHTLALTGLPDVALRVVPRGPVAEAMRRGQGLINDPRVAGAWVVTLPEQLPITEAIELMDGLRATSVPLRAVIVNRFIDDPFTDEERVHALRILAARPSRGHLAFDRITRGRAALGRLQAATGAPLIRLREIPRVDGDPCTGLTTAFATLAGRPA